MIQGDTVQLRATFLDYDNQPYSPTDLVVTVYDGERNELAELTAGISGLGNGVHSVDYTIPAGVDEIVVEWAGKDATGDPVVSRQTYSVSWTN